MLRTLVIENVVLISRLEIDFSAGLCVLTGETGAGKSILLDALGLALGERASASLVRPGQEQAVVSASFEVPQNHSVARLLLENDYDFSGELILRRIVTNDGKSKAYLNDHLVGVSFLKKLSKELIEIHGQFDQILQPATHRHLLDHFAGYTPLLSRVSTAYNSYKILRQQLEDAEKFIEEQKNQQEFLAAAVEEFETVDPKEHEENELIDKRNLLQNQEKIIAGARSSAHLIGGDKGILDLLGATLNTLEKTSKLCPEKLDETLKALNRAHSDVLEAEATLNTFQDRVTGRDESLDSVEDRLYQLRALARKHGCLIPELPTLYEKFKGESALLKGGSESLAALKKDLAEARTAYLMSAEELHQQRLIKGKELARAVEQELKPLKLEKATFRIDPQKLPEPHWSALGTDHVEFEVQTNPGLPFGSIAKIASGGERSRFMLALKVVLAHTTQASILVFDEIDSGVGGAVASAIGERMARLGQQRQVLAITHSPQVASYANRHFFVEKYEDDQNMTQTTVSILKEKQSLEEIARMLSGDQVSQEARAAASQLLHVAQKVAV
ncbi:MAG: DNA repair protein RecN [Alphaproteobacteria bacterium]|nr:DNA repair protein RecN [Alphaproteobacteria bacterium]